MIEEHFNDLMDACTNDEQRQKVIASRTKAQATAAGASHVILQGNEPHVQNLISSMETTQKELESKLKDLKDVVAVIDLLTKAIQLGTKLVTLGI